MKDAVCHKCRTPAPMLDSPGHVAAHKTTAVICNFRHLDVQLTLFIPDLLPPPGAERAATGAAPVLRRMCGRGNLLHFPAIDSETWLCQAFEVEKQHDWPVAALTALVDGLAAESGTWLRADPVHLQLQRDRSLVLAAPALQITAAEAAALTASLNAHFAADGITLNAAQPARWYLAHAEAATITAPMLSAVAGRPLPRAQLAGRWHRWLTEIQMLLHEHPVNAAREQRGAPVINSLLLWGGGHKPAVPGKHYSHVWSTDPLAVALAVQCGAEHAAAPGTAAAWLAAQTGKSAAETRHLVVLEQAHHAARYEGPEAWRHAVSALEDGWFAPLWSALGNTVSTLDIVTTDPERCLRVMLRPADRFKFWRRTPDWPALSCTR